MNTEMAARRAWGWMACLLLAGTMGGCATVANPDPRDPFESYNRSVTKFNEAVDNAVLKPVATVYKEVLPKPVRSGVGNFFDNLGDAWSFVNNVLQGKPEGSLHSFWRVVINSTIGIGGLFDPATEMRLERHREDFGQTLGSWGVPSGPYFVLPILGPSTIRDAAALPVDYMGYPLGQVHDVPVRNSLAGVRIIETRARVLGVEDMLDAAALDSYTFTRDAYLQKRRNDVYDGMPPDDEERYDLDEGASEATPPAPADAAPSAAPAPRPPRRPRRPARPAPDRSSGVLVPIR